MLDYKLYPGKTTYLNFMIKSSFFNEIDYSTWGDFRKQFRHGGQSNTEKIITSIYSTDFSLSWTQPLSMFMSLRCCAIFTGCIHRRESNAVWRCWRSVVNMEWLHRTCHQSVWHCFLTTPAVVDDGTGQWSCPGRNFLQSATVRFRYQLQPHTCEIVCRRLLPSHRHSLI